MSSSPLQRALAFEAPTVAINGCSATAPKPSAPEQREHRRAEAARLLTRSLAAHDVTIVETATVLGVNPRIVQRWGDRERPETIPLCDVHTLDERVALDHLRDAAAKVGAGYDVVSRATHDVIANDLHHLAERTRASAKVEALFLEHLSDGALDAAEADDLLRALDEEDVLRAQLRARCRTAIALRSDAQRTGGKRSKSNAPLAKARRR